MGERPIFSTKAHVFQIDPETRKKWIPSSTQAVVVSYYHDSVKKTYRIIAIDNSKALINSTITANMTFTKTSPKFGQWSDHRASTVYGLGFAAETDLAQFAEKFREAKEALKALILERQKAAQASTTCAAKQDDSPPLPVSSPPAVSNSNSCNNQDTGIADGENDLEKPETPTVVRKEHNQVEMVPTEEKMEFQPVVSSSTAEVSVTQSNEQVVKKHIPAMEEKPQSSPSTGKKSVPSVATQGMSMEAQLQQLKYENEKMKSALSTSSSNGKKWEAELQTLKNNNARLTTALQESKSNVNKWKQQLNAYQEESASLKKRVQEMETSQHTLTTKSSDDIDKLQREKSEMEDQLVSLETKLNEKSEKCETLERKMEEYKALEEMYSSASSDLKIVTQERDDLREQVNQLSDQLKLATAASNSRLQEAGEKHAELGQRIESLLELHGQLGEMLQS